MVLAFVALRLYATLGADIGRSGDTPGYFELGLWGARRFPVMTSLYTLVDAPRAIVTIQAVVGAACWATAAVVVGALVGRGWISLGLIAAVLGLGLTTPITRFDSALVSESIAISLAVLLTALLLRLSCHPSRRGAIAVLVVVLLWTFTRQSNPMIVLLVAALVLIVPGALRPRRFSLRFTGALAVIACAGLVLASSNTVVQEVNTAQVLQRRIIGEAHEAWFIERGMPATGQEILRTPPASRRGSRSLLRDDPEFRRWLHEDGMRVYAQFLVTHPAYVITTPVEDAYPVKSFLTGTDGSVRYGGTRTVVPRPIEALYWPRTARELALAALVAIPLSLAGVVICLRRRRVPEVGPMALCLLAVAAANVLVVTHTAGATYPRLLTAAGASGRVAWLVIVAGAFALRAERDRRLVAEPAAQGA